MDFSEGSKYWFITINGIFFGEVKKVIDGFILFDKCYFTIDYGNRMSGIKMTNARLQTNKIVSYSVDMDNFTMTQKNQI